MHEKSCICLACDEIYAKLSYITILSIVKNLGSLSSIEIVILLNSVSDETAKLFYGLQRSTVHIRLIDIAGESAKIINRLPSIRNLSATTYCRLLIPEIFPDYSKVLYLDSDIIVLYDIKELLDFDLHHSLVGAAYDTNSYQFRGKYKIFVENDLGISPIDYCNAGVLLFNIKKCLNFGFTQKSIDFAQQHSDYLPYMDQDVLNCIAAGGTKQIPRDWHITVYSYGQYRLQGLIDKNRREFLRRYINFQRAAKHPKLLHFAGPIKPWKFPSFVKHGLIWWEYARQSPFTFVPYLGNPSLEATELI